MNIVKSCNQALFKLNQLGANLTILEIRVWLDNFNSIFDYFELPPHHSENQYEFYTKYSELTKLSDLTHSKNSIFVKAISESNKNTINKTLTWTRKYQNLWIDLVDYFDCEWTQTESLVLMKSNYLGCTIKFEKTEPMVLFFFAYQKALEIVPPEFWEN